MRSLIKVYTVRHQDHIKISLIIGLQTVLIPTQAKIRKLKINKRKKYFVSYPRNQDLAFEISFLLSNFLVMYKRKFELDAKPYFSRKYITKYKYYKRKYATQCEQGSSKHANADSQGPDEPVHAQSDQGLRCPLTESLLQNMSLHIRQVPDCVVSLTGQDHYC